MLQKDCIHGQTCKVFEKLLSLAGWASQEAKAYHVIETVPRLDMIRLLPIVDNIMTICFKPAGPVGIKLSTGLNFEAVEEFDVSS